MTVCSITKVSIATVAIAACTPAPDAPVVEECVDVSAEGTTTGDMRTLHGDATFVFGGTVREAGVGIYLNDLVVRDDGSMDLSIVYQFTWPNGDLMLTNDPVRFEPTLDPDTYTFSLELTVSSGKGMFASLEGHRPFRLSAEIGFGPPEKEGELNTAMEQFTIGGRLCPA